MHKNDFSHFLSFQVMPLQFFSPEFFYAKSVTIRDIFVQLYKNMY